MKYHRPETLQDYLKLTAHMAQDAPHLLAGGTDLVPGWERGRALPASLIDIKRVRDLQGIADLGDRVTIGACTTIEALRKSPIIRTRLTALAESADDFGSKQIRQRATIGGNIVNASPAGDTLPPLYACSAMIHLAGPAGERKIPLRDLIKGPGAAGLRKGEIVTKIEIPVTDLKSQFVKLGLRNTMAISVVNFAVVYTCSGNTFTDLRIAAGAVAPTVVGLERYCTAVLKKPAAVTTDIDLIDLDIAPIDDLRASAKYRRQVLKNLVQHTLNQALDGRHE